jgi:biotin carboxylase
MKLLIIGGGQAQLPLVEAALDLGLHVTVVDERGLEASDLAHEVVSCNRYDYETIVQLTGFDAVVSGGSDKAVYIMAKYAKMHGLKAYVSPEVAELPMQKGRTREILHQAGLKVPRSVYGDAVVDLCAPFVVKPVDGIGQTGVSFVDIDGLQEAIKVAQGASESGIAIIQEFIEGVEVGVNGFVTDGVFKLYTAAIRDGSRLSDQTFGVALTKTYDKHLDLGDENLELILGRACTALGYANCPIYAQLILGADGFYIIECMPRISGGEDPRLVKLATGFDMADATIRLACGMAQGHKGVGAADIVQIQFLTVQPGVIEEITGVDEALRIEGIAHARVFYKAGHKVDAVKSSRERVGCVIAAGDRDIVQEAVSEALSTIKVKMKNLQL